MAARWPWEVWEGKKAFFETCWDAGDTDHANSSLLTAGKFEVSPGQSNPFQSFLDVVLKCSSLFHSIHLDEIQIFLVLSHPGDEIRSAVRHSSILKPRPSERLASWIQLPLKPKLPRGCRTEGWRPPRRCRRLASTFRTFQPSTLSWSKGALGKTGRTDAHDSSVVVCPISPCL